MYKEWPVHMKVVLIVMEEFWSQGDEEKKQGLKPVQLMDRALSYLLPDDQALKNVAKWSELAALSLEEKKEAVHELLLHRPSAASQASSATSL
ncbi:unnamed protein product [Schistocephalus solidus]|uniref:PDEase domain-containing protein n=1 Tax=Schistocephalus solidus TaxID=70667 RepID=A0A183T1P2_SCHSO|nr:unnamed protein product [Schistocephalus solidus]